MSDDEKKDKRVKIKVEEESAPTEVLPDEKPAEEVKTTEESTETVKEEAPKEEKTEEKVEKPAPENKEKTSFFILFISFLIGLLLGAGLIGGFFYYRQKVENVATSETSLTPIPTYSAETVEGSPEASASASSKPSADFSKYSVQILNGSGIAGEAGKVETLLNDAGFSKTTTGNAKAYDYEETEVAMKESVSSSIFDEISSALSKYSLKEADTLPSSSSYDVVITVGSTKK